MRPFFSYYGAKYTIAKYAGPALAKRLMEIAARRSTETQFGWAHPDCVALEDAARIVSGHPPRVERSHDATSDPVDLNSLPPLAERD